MRKKAAQDDSGQIAGAQSIRRTIHILRVLARERLKGAPLIDVTQATRLSRPTAHRILRCLIEERMVVQDEDTRRYLLGPLSYELGLAATYRPKQLEIYREALQRVAENTKDTCYLTLRSGADSFSIDRIEATYPIRTVTADIGERRPLGSGGAGLAMLATLEDDEVAKIVEANARIYPLYGTTAKKVLQSVDDARKTGFAIRVDYPAPGGSSIGVAIPSIEGPAAFAMSISSTTERIMDRMPELKAILNRELAGLVRALNLRSKATKAARKPGNGKRAGASS